MKKEPRLKWDRTVEMEYERKMRERAIEIGNNSLGIQERWENLIRNIWETGKELKLVREQRGAEGEDRDGDIKAQKRKVWEVLKKWVRTRREEDRIELKEEKKRLKEIRREKKEEGREKQRKRVENSKSMSEFWAAIRGYRPRRKRKGENIEKEKWINHFKNLLGGENEGEIRGEAGEDKEKKGDEGAK